MLQYDLFEVILKQILFSPISASNSQNKFYCAWGTECEECFEDQPKAV